jgi:hypothetical protein
MRFAPIFFKTTIPAPTRNVLFNLRTITSVQDLSPLAFIYYLHAAGPTTGLAANGIPDFANLTDQSGLFTSALFSDVARALQFSSLDPYNGVRTWLAHTDTGPSNLLTCIEEIVVCDEQAPVQILLHFKNGTAREYFEPTGVGIDALMNTFIRAGCIYLGLFGPTGVTPQPGSVPF